MSITCFHDDGRVVADSGLVAEATDVFTEHLETVLVAHDQVRHGAAGPAVVLEHREPLLMWDTETNETLWEEDNLKKHLPLIL